jgi:hypothetical protein
MSTVEEVVVVMLDSVYDLEFVTVITIFLAGKYNYHHEFYLMAFSGCPEQNFD